LVPQNLEIARRLYAPPASHGMPKPPRVPLTLGSPPPVADGAAQIRDTITADQPGALMRDRRKRLRQLLFGERLAEQWCAHFHPAGSSAKPLARITGQIGPMFADGAHQLHTGHLWAIADRRSPGRKTAA